MDAARLDVELTGMLKEQLMKVFSLSQVSLVFLYVLAWSGPFLWAFWCRLCWVFQGFQARQNLVFFCFVSIFSKLPTAAETVEGCCL